MVLEMEDVSLNPLIIREELQLQMETGKQLKAGLNPLIIREELQPTDEQIGVILARLNPLIIREELQRHIGLNAGFEKRRMLAELSSGSAMSLTL